MKKQSGFTLIELMVVMAIIAILATAGLAAYTGYIKKARDTTRIADLSAINTIILADMAADGLPPQTVGELRTAITNSNNGNPILDPHQTTSGTDGSGLCLTNGAGTATTGACSYYYQTCNSATQYRVMSRLESTANRSLYNASSATNIATCATSGDSACLYYAIGTCLGDSTATDAVTAIATI